MTKEAKHSGRWLDRWVYQTSCGLMCTRADPENPAHAGLRRA